MQKWTVNSLADETGFDRRTVKKILQDVSPVDSDDKSDFYHLRDFIDARDKYGAADGGGDLKAAQTRLTSVNADIAEVERARLRNEVLETETVFRVWENIIVAIRRTILTSALTDPEKDSILNDLKNLKLEDFVEQREFDQGTPAENA